MKYIPIFILILLSLLMIGSYNPQELDDQAYVIGIGADVADSGEISITYQVAIPVKIGGEGNNSTGSDTYTTYTVKAKSLYDGNAKVNSITSKEVDLSHIKIIVYSEELAKQDLSGHINSLITNVEIRPKTYVAVCKGKASDFFNKVNPKLESSPARFYDLLLSSYNYSSGIAESSLIDFYTNCESIDVDAFAVYLETKPKDSENHFNASNDEDETSKVPNDHSEINNNPNTSENSNQTEQSSNNDEKIRSEQSNNNNRSDPSSSNSDGNSKSQGTGTSANSSTSTEDSQVILDGIALFSAGKMVYELPAESVKSYLIIDNSLKKTNLVVSDIENKEKYVSLSLRKNSNTKVKVTIENDIPNISIEADLIAHIESIGTTTDYFNNENKEKLEKKVEDSLKKSLDEYMDILISNKSDINGFGKYARKNFRTWKEFEHYNWKEKFANATYDIKVNVEVDVSAIIFHRLPNK